MYWWDLVVQKFIFLYYCGGIGDRVPLVQTMDPGLTVRVWVSTRPSPTNGPRRVLHPKGSKKTIQLFNVFSLEVSAIHYKTPGGARRPFLLRPEENKGRKRTQGDLIRGTEKREGLPTGMKVSTVPLPDFCKVKRLYFGRGSRSQTKTSITGGNEKGITNRVVN